MRCVCIILLLQVASSSDVLDDAESLLQVKVNEGLDNSVLDEIASNIGKLIADTVETSRQIYTGVSEDFASVGLDLRSLGAEPGVSMLQGSAEVSGDEEAVVDESATAEKKEEKPNDFQTALFAKIAKAAAEHALGEEDDAAAPEPAEAGAEEATSAEGEETEPIEARVLIFKPKKPSRANDAEDLDFPEGSELRAEGAERVEEADGVEDDTPVIPRSDVPQDPMMQDPLYASDPLLMNQPLGYAPLAPPEPQFPPVYESQFKVADERPLRPGETFKPAVIPLNPLPVVTEQAPLLRSEDPLLEPSQPGVINGQPVEYYNGPAYVAPEYVPPPPAPVEAIQPMDVKPVDMSLPETMAEPMPEPLSQPVEPAAPVEPEVELEKPMGYYEEDLVKTSDLIGLRAVPVKEEMYTKPFTLPEMPKLRAAEGDESSEVKSIDERWLRQARTRATAWAAKAAGKTAGFMAGNAVRKQLEAKVNPFLMAVDKYMEEKIENATRRINLDVNLRTLRTSQALADAAVHVWANLTGADNGKLRENALYRLIDELRLENQPPSAKFRLLYGIDRALRGHAHHLGDATYSLFSTLTEEQIAKRFAERRELLGQKTISAASPHDGGSNPLWRGSRAGKPAPEYDVHKLTKTLESMQKPEKL